MLTRLQPKLSELKKRAGFKLLSDQEHKADIGYEPSLTVKYINSWIKAKNCVAPTWKNFLRILKDVSPELSKLSDQIELYIAGKGRITYQAGDSHVRKDGTTNMIENVTADNQISQNGISVNADSEQNIPSLRNGTVFHNQTYNSKSRDNFVGRKSIPISDETSFDNRGDQKYHQFDGKPDSTNNQISLLPDDTLDDKKQEDQPSSDWTTSHGLTSYSYKPSMHEQPESASKLAPEWMQEPNNNKIYPVDGQIKGMAIYKIQFDV